MEDYGRKRSDADLYHVFARGTGQRIIFEDDADRREYARRMGGALDAQEGELYAWCLMGNHVHLLVHMTAEDMAKFVKVLHGGYARFFNERHGRSGHLFENRFGSEPIDSDEQLLMAVRYIHRNPIKPGLSRTCDYPWSSYREYLGEAGPTSTGLVLDLFGSLHEFVEFHRADGRETFLDARSDARPTYSRMTDDEAVRQAIALVGRDAFESLPAMNRRARDEHIHALKRAGLSVRQIALITGIGRSIVQRA